jgi:hypothetical protein
MKLIGAAQGLVGIRLSIEEVIPQSSPPAQNIIAGIKAFFNFSVAPIPQTIATVPWQFADGKITKGKQEIGVPQMVLFPDGDLAIATTTDLAEIALDSLIDYLKKEFGYRYGGPSEKRLYASSLVVEFDAPFADIIPQIAKMQNIFAEAGGRGSRSVEFLRIGFSEGAHGSPYLPLPTATLLDSLERTDFVIERRVGHQFAENRFFCSAPLRTKDHIKALESIERALAK